MVKGRKNSKGRKQLPLTTVRRSQIVTTFGIGSLIPVEQESFIVLGQDEWPSYWVNREAGRYLDQETGRNINEIEQPDLSQALGGVRFVVPPTGDVQVPVRRFPQWASCPQCHRLGRWISLAHKNLKGEYENICKHCLSEQSRLVTSRFVVACRAGHLDDFPYYQWVHRGVDGEGSRQRHDLWLDTTGQEESLKGIVVSCSCGASRSMEGALGRNSTRTSCSGAKPWLDDSNNDDCSETPFGLQRGATRVWQQKVASAISLDKTESAEFQVIRKNSALLATMPDFMVETNLAGFASHYNLDLDALKRAYKIILGQGGDALTMDEIREMEYKALCEGRPEDPEKNDDQAFVCDVKEASPRARAEWHLDLTASVPKLREVRALTGFSRVDPREGEKITSAPLAKWKQDWLPAIEVFGEGIFVRFSEEAIRRWEKTQFAQSRTDMINRARGNDEVPVEVTPRHLLLHSAAHMILNELALRAGYPASSIRERVYDGPEQSGILLYTAGTDSAGSLGGLCALGSEENLLKTIGAGVETAGWCSADPVCIESPVHGPRNLNLAACHYCMLLPEVSCERQNQILDRACLVGTPEEPTGGFFSSLLER